MVVRMRVPTCTLDTPSFSMTFECLSLKCWLSKLVRLPEVLKIFRQIVRQVEEVLLQVNASHMEGGLVFSIQEGCWLFPSSL